MNIFRKKTISSVLESKKSDHLHKHFGGFDLILLGLGAIIGTGVFVLTGMVAAKYSGPAVTLSYGIAGLTCIFVALAYTELATMIPTSGSVYTYSYVAIGEVAAWMMGSIMILELTFGAATVAAGWSSYIQGILDSAGIDIPKAYTLVPYEGGIVNLPAMLIVAFVGGILYLGTKDSKRLNAILVMIKLVAIGAFIFTAAPHFDASNWKNFIPYGVDEVLLGASILFFAFTGFGVLATAAEECKNPKKDLTIGIIGSLIIATIVYMLVAGLVTGIIPFDQLDTAQPLAVALKANGSKIGCTIVAVGAVCGMTTVLMMNIYAQSRIFYVIARDGLIPKYFATLHPKYESPYVTIIFFSAITALIAGFCPYGIVGQLSSMGALIDYIVVVAVVVILRIKLPKNNRAFKCPVIYIIASIALSTCIYLLFKQIIGKDGSLLYTGKLIILWLLVMLGLYLVSRFTKTKILN